MNHMFLIIKLDLPYTKKTTLKILQIILLYQIKKLFVEHFEGNQFDDIKITDMWKRIKTFNEYHPPHTHSNNFYSGVFYLDAEDTSSSICFSDPKVRQM